MSKKHKPKVRKISKKEEASEVPGIKEGDMKVIMKQGDKPEMTMEEQLVELKKPYFIAKGIFEVAMDSIIGRLIGQQMQLQRVMMLQKQAIDKFKKMVPKNKWPKVTNE